jgi:hypothetical protein
MALAELVERGCIEVIVTTFSPRRCDRIARAGIERRSRGGMALLAGTHRIPGLVSLGTSTPMCPRTECRCGANRGVHGEQRQRRARVADLHHDRPGPCSGQLAGRPLGDDAARSQISSTSSSRSKGTITVRPSASRCRIPAEDPATGFWARSARPARSSRCLIGRRRRWRRPGYGGAVPARWPTEVTLALPSRERAAPSGTGAPHSLASPVASG